MMMCTFTATRSGIFVNNLKITIANSIVELHRVTSAVLTDISFPVTGYLQNSKLLCFSNDIILHYNTLSCGLN